jgi:hypothetical protein
VVDLAISQKSVAEIVVEAKMHGEGLVSEKIKNFHKTLRKYELKGSNW